MRRPTNFKVLILAGGQSSRMGSPKHLLPFIDGRPLFLHLLERAAAGFPGPIDAHTFYMSVKNWEDIAPVSDRLPQATDTDYKSIPTLTFISDDKVRPEFAEAQYDYTSNEPTGLSFRKGDVIEIIYKHENGWWDGVDRSNNRGWVPSNYLRVLPPDERYTDIGPAAGLLSAFRTDPEAHWLICACNYPLLPSAELWRLRKEYDAPVTCFKNDRGAIEPLVGLWSPDALRSLDMNIRSGRWGLKFVVQDLEGKLLEPTKDVYLTNANTPDEWKESLHRAFQMKEQWP